MEQFQKSAAYVMQGLILAGILYIVSAINDNHERMLRLEKTLALTVQKLDMHITLEGYPNVPGSKQ